MAQPAKQVVVQTEPAATVKGALGVVPLGHDIGVNSEPPHIFPARGPPSWGDCSDAVTDEEVHIEPDWNLAAQPAPDYEVDQRISW